MFVLTLAKTLFQVSREPLSYVRIGKVLASTRTAERRIRRTRTLLLLHLVSISTVLHLPEKTPHETELNMQVRSFNCDRRKEKTQL